MLKQIALGLATIAMAGTVASCAMSGKPPPAMAARGEFRPTGPLALGDYAKESDSAIRGQFSKTVVQRYVAGAPLPQVDKDLADNKFACAAAQQTGGDPPDRVCKRQIKASNCTYTFQVHLYNDPGRTGLARVRGLYDKACGEELLGG